MKPTKPAKETFTTTEVGTLVEGLRSEFRTVVEVVAPLPGRLSAVEDRLSRVEVRLTGVEDAVRIALPSLSKRVSRIETKLSI